MRAGLYFHTLRHLRPAQISRRLVFGLRKPRPDRAAAPPLRSGNGAWVACPRRPSAHTAPNRFRFLGVEQELRTAADWNNPAWEKLWLYNLHYFDDLAAPNFGALAERWIAENPAAGGNGWEPYPLSLRVVNWIKWSLAGNALSPAMRHSLAIQSRYLTQRLEWHLLGNHLFANAKALVFAGSYFEGSEAQRWLARGRAILDRELPEQIGADGAHFELSPMYHAIILEDLLDLANLSRVYPGLLPRALLESLAASMLRWLATVTHPDGDLAFFNDTALGIASEPSRIAEYAARLGIFAVAAPPPGGTANYLRMEVEGACAIVDVAPIGPDYIPGHAHADTLSFELSLAGERIIVNSGTSTYAASQERLRQRSTAAHSTVEIDGENSSEVWSSFRVARRARPFGLTISNDSPAMQGVTPVVRTVACSHDGYRRLPGRPLHRREWQLSARHLAVRDSFEGRFAQAVARFHFHPDCTVIECSERAGVLRTKSENTLRWSVEGGRCRVVETTYHPRFGVVLPNRCLEVETVDSSLATLFNWHG